jgi:nucleoside-diphosphate-sugar epimerase
MVNTTLLHSPPRKGTSRLSVVTGAAGFLGKALVWRLLAEGDVVRAIVLKGDPLVDELRNASHQGATLEVVEGDVTDYGSIQTAFRKATRVFHTAAVVHAWASWETYRRVNVGGTRNVARAVMEHGVPRLVAVSTSDVFGIPRGGERMDESSALRPWSEPYPDSKIEAEIWLWQFRAETGLPLSVIYPCWIYGPGDRALFPSFAEAIGAGVMVYWFRNVRLAWVYIDNLVDACLLASEDPAAVGSGYLVHDGMDGPTLDQVCARIADTIGARRPRLRIPYRLMYGAAASMQLLWRFLRIKEPPLLRTVDIKAFGFQWELSNDKVQRELGWSPRVSIEEGMKRALEYLGANWGR